MSANERFCIHLMRYVNYAPEVRHGRASLRFGLPLVRRWHNVFRLRIVSPFGMLKAGYGNMGAKHATPAWKRDELVSKAIFEALL